MRRNNNNNCTTTFLINNNTTNNNNNMEQSFYEDNAQFMPGNTLKRPLTLDLNEKPLAKKQRINNNQPMSGPILLNSPDLQMLKLNTPELEKFIMSSNSFQTPTPSILFPAKVTTEQEEYVKGFEEALNYLHNTENPQSIPMGTVVTTGMSGGSITYTNLDETYPVSTIKDEPQTVPNSQPVSPIDMESQERIKLERKRQRNRVAASKCRKRKLERISKLEDKVKTLKVENADLAVVIKQLKEHVCQLKQKVIDHVNAGCQITSFNTTMLPAK